MSEARRKIFNHLVTPIASGPVLPSEAKEMLDDLVRERPKPVSPQRSQFDSALRTLLIRENLDGTEWAIAQIREAASASNDLPFKESLETVADALEGSLDKRTAQLATRDEG